MLKYARLPHIKIKLILLCYGVIIHQTAKMMTDKLVEDGRLKSFMNFVISDDMSPTPLKSILPSP